jgi:signal transduction histidine kinase
MTDRARQFTSGDLRDEKLVSLGKLAAGLAHELNNPASAVLRAARSMTEALATAGNSASGLIAARLTDIQLGELERVRTLAMHTATDRGESGLALADREEALAGWIAAHGASEETAPELAHTSITIDALNRLAGVVRGVQLETSLRFLAAHHTVHSLAIDLERAATRIHQLVSAVKRFTHMDRDLDQGPVDIPSGLADTVALLDGKARSRSVTIDLKVDSSLPPALGVSAEINQIWMNLVDNAIDALSPGGRVAIHASAEHPMIIVEVEDNGSGIPEELVGRIFDPFFTTKEVGEGTGLGLDIVRRIIDRHAGSIDVTSRPGRTLFRVALPAHP